MRSPDLPEIQGWFVVMDRIYEKVLSASISKDCIDIPLPVRELAKPSMIYLGGEIENPSVTGVVVEPIIVRPDDVLKALILFGKKEDADHWANKINPDKKLIFNGSKGQLYLPPDDLLTYMPGLAEFDQIEL